MKKFSVHQEPTGLRPFVVVDERGTMLTQRTRRKQPNVRRWKTAEAAQKVADLCNEAELYPHS